MGRPKKDEVWNFYINGPSKSVKCKLCNKTYKFANVTKMRSHLMKCVNCPFDVREVLRKKTVEVGPSRDSLTALTNHLQMAKSSSSSMLSPVQEMSLEKSSDLDDTTPVLLFNVVSETQKFALDRKLAKAIYVSGAPLSMVEQPLWKEFFDKLQSSYKLPSKKYLSTTLLDEVFNETEQEITERLASVRDLHMQLNGESNIGTEGIINFFILTPDPTFVKYLNTGCNSYTSEYLANEIIDVLKKYGEEKFFVLIGDNAKNMQSALQIVQRSYPHIVPLGCVAHALNILYHDYIKCVSLNNIVDLATQIIKTIKSSQVLSALYAKIIKEKRSGQQLKLPCKTRRSNIIASLESLQHSKASLQALAVNERCNLSKNAKDALLSEDFWNNTIGTLSLLKPISKWIFELESNNYNICNVLTIFTEIEETKYLQVSYLIQKNSNLLRI